MICVGIILWAQERMSYPAPCPCPLGLASGFTFHHGLEARSPFAISVFPLCVIMGIERVEVVQLLSSWQVIITGLDKTSLYRPMYLI